MSKRQSPKKTTKQKTITATGTVIPLKHPGITDKIIHLISDKRIQLLFIVAIISVFYGNSINNDFAFDDGEFYSSNQFVQKGVDGIYDLFTKESMYGYYGHATPAGGTCWRPLTLITFAIEKECFGGDPHVSHFINMVLLVITGIIMLLFLRQYIFKSSPVAAFIAALLFIIHPVHTEAVSHIKSRDELLSWLFLLLTMYCSLNFLTKRNYWQLALSMLFYFFGLLSKEYGVSFIIILPLTFYFFTKEKLRVILFATLPYIVVLGIYAFIRFSIVPVISNISTDVVFRPYLYATPVQRLATELMVLGKYILLLLWPNPLKSDYSYNQVPYVDFSDWRVWLSVVIQAALVLYALLNLKEKKLMSYGILFYFCSIFIVSNIIIDTDSVIGERFLYQPSFGFCIVIVALATELLKKINFKNTAQKFSILSLLISAIILLSGFQTVRRNTEWTTSRALLDADIKKSPNSLLARITLGNNFMRDGVNAPIPQQRNADFNNALNEYDTALKILPNYPLALGMTGYVYSLLDNNDEAIKYFLNCINADSTFSQGYNGLGTAYYNEKNYEQALNCFKKSAQLDPVDALPYFNMGLCYSMLGQYEESILYYKKTLNLTSNTQEAKNNLINLQIVKQDLLNAENQLQNKKQ